MKRWTAVVALLLTIALVGCVSTPAKPASAEIVILHINDFHAQLEADKNGQAGAAALATLVKAEKAAATNVLFLSAGDLNTGQIVSDANDGKPTIEALNLIGLDVTAIGNHEFDKYFDVLQTQMKMAKFDFVAANIRTKAGAAPFKAYVVKTVGGLKVGIFGITTSDTPIKAHPLKVADFVFSDEIAAATETVKILREKEKVDIVIALTHIGIGEGAGPVPSDKLAAALSGVDLIVDGHSHTDMATPTVVNGIPVVQASWAGLKLGKAMLTYDNGKVALKGWASLPVNLKKDGAFIGTELAQDPTMVALVKKYSDALSAKYSEPVCTTSGEFALGDKLTRKQETELGDLVADSMIWKARQMGIKADLALTNGGGIRKSLPSGAVTRKNVYEVLPFGNTLATFSLTGEQLIALFDGVGKIGPGDGAFANVSKEVAYTLDLNQGKLTSVTVGGKAIDPKATYVLVTNDFIAVGGDGKYPLLKTLPWKDTKIDMYEGMVEYLKALKQPVAPALDGRIKVIPKATGFLFIYRRAA